MAGVNKVILLGNLGKDPEVKHLESGSVVANLALATSESYKDREGNRVETTEWHYLEMWEGLAKVAEGYLRKGDTIYVEGKIKTRTWQDDQGNNRKEFRIRVINMNIVKRANPEQPIQPLGSSAEPQPVPQQQTAPTNTEQGVDDLPF